MEFSITKSGFRLAKKNATFERQVSCFRAPLKVLRPFKEGYSLLTKYIFYTATPSPAFYDHHQAQPRYSMGQLTGLFNYIFHYNYYHHHRHCPHH